MEFYQVLRSETAQSLLGFVKSEVSDDDDLPSTYGNDWTKFISVQISNWPRPHDLLPIGKAAFDTFLQATVTGPPLSWRPSDLVFPETWFHGTDKTHEHENLRKQIRLSLGADAEAFYHLAPHVELFYLAKRILNYSPLAEDPGGVLARLRVNFWHQKLLNDVSPSLQEQIYSDVHYLDTCILEPETRLEWITPAEYLIERANIHLFYGFDVKAREGLVRAARERSFHFSLTGRLGKRTKFQERDLSQLVVIAKSAESQLSTSDLHNTSRTEPKALDLNDDTLLESITFSSGAASHSNSDVDEELPAALQSIDPGNQPLLNPLDAIILLATASSIKNTSPVDGLTREETLPFAGRVLSGGSSNWQVYTQALLVRSRIEGYKSRTIERSVLQLQAIVDQVLAETDPSGVFGHASHSQHSQENASTSFLPQLKASESAPASERLRYIHQLASMPRWKLESELADRWVSLGGLQTALEIYERLQMWAEVALCWAANDREDKARDILQLQLYNSVSLAEDWSNDNEHCSTGDGTSEKDPLPADAPRLFCILGDIEKSPAAYKRAWDVSNCRYARAQRSLGKYYATAGDFPMADDAYAKSLRVNPQNHATWFALGCVRLQTEDWKGAVQAFGRTVQIDDADAESWSNLAVALLSLPPDCSPGVGVIASNRDSLSDGEDETSARNMTDPQKHVREAFIALKRAAALKRDSFRIWQNLLSVSIRLSPPPYTDIIIAQTRLIDLLGKLKGENCIDIEIVEALVAQLVASPSPPPERASQVYPDNEQSSDHDTESDPTTRRPGFEKMVIDLVQKKITPLITSSRRLWLLTAKTSLYLKHPFATLASYEKAWRVTLNQPGWEIGGVTLASRNAWTEVWESTIDLLKAYESLGERGRESGMTAGEMVAKDWKFKARSAVRSVLSRAKDGWEDNHGYAALQDKLQALRNV